MLHAESSIETWEWAWGQGYYHCLLTVANVLNFGDLIIRAGEYLANHSLQDHGYKV